VSFVVEFIRGTPLLVQLYFIFYVLPDAGILLPPLVAGVIGMGLHYATYTAEVYRAGIENVARGQWEAARATNLTTRQTWVHVIMPAGGAADDPGAGELPDRHVQGDAAPLGHYRA
jgi:polar amino acid transport system permease protein